MKASFYLLNMILTQVMVCTRSRKQKFVSFQAPRVYIPLRPARHWIFITCSSPCEANTLRPCFNIIEADMMTLQTSSNSSRLPELVKTALNILDWN